MIDPRNKNGITGIALGSGSARGLAHIGVIRALEEAGIQIDCVAGTSMGALVGSVYASGKLNELEQTYLDFDWKQIASLFDVVFPKSGLIDGKKVGDFIKSYLHAENIEQLPLPFRAIATDLLSGEEACFAQGNVIEAVRASISVPGIFTPVRHGDRILADGGLVNPVPVSAVRAMGAEFVIAVDVNANSAAGLLPTPEELEPSPEPNLDQPQSLVSQVITHIDTNYPDIGRGYQTVADKISKSLQSIDNPTVTQMRSWFAQEPLPNIFEVLVASINIMTTQITQIQLAANPPDLLIQPKLNHIRLLDFASAEEIIEIGYLEAQKQLQNWPG